MFGPGTNLRLVYYRFDLRFSISILFGLWTHPETRTHEIDLDGFADHLQYQATGNAVIIDFGETKLLNNTW